MSDDPILDSFFARFAEHLIPEAFGRPTSADRVELEPDGLTAADPPRFEAWLEGRLHEALTAAWPVEHPRAVVFLSDGVLCWRYEECGCGYLDCALRPAAEEAVAVDTPWVLGAWLPRPLPRWEPVLDQDGNELHEILVGPEDRRWLATWYAEGRGRGVATSRAGVISLDGEVATWCHEVPPRETPAGRQLHRILLRHPARRRHPLRRRR